MIKQLCHRAAVAEIEMRKLSTKVKNKILREVAKALIAEQDDILEANKLDLADGEKTDSVPLCSIVWHLIRVESKYGGLFRNHCKFP